MNEGLLLLSLSGLIIIIIHIGLCWGDTIFGVWSDMRVVPHSDTAHAQSPDICRGTTMGTIPYERWRWRGGRRWRYYWQRLKDDPYIFPTPGGKSFCVQMKFFYGSKLHFGHHDRIEDARRERDRALKCRQEIDLWLLLPHSRRLGVLGTRRTSSPLDPLPIQAISCRKLSLVSSFELHEHRTTC